MDDLMAVVMACMWVVGRVAKLAGSKEGTAFEWAVKKVALKDDH